MALTNAEGWLLGTPFGGLRSHPTQEPAGARLRAFACPDRHLRPLEGPGGCGASECHLHTRCNPDVSLLSAPHVSGLHTVNAICIRGCVRIAHGRDGIKPRVKSPPATPALRSFPHSCRPGSPSGPQPKPGNNPRTVHWNDDDARERAIAHTQAPSGSAWRKADVAGQTICSSQRCRGRLVQPGKSHGRSRPKTPLNRSRTAAFPAIRAASSARISVSERGQFANRGRSPTMAGAAPR